MRYFILLAYIMENFEVKNKQILFFLQAGENWQMLVWIIINYIYTCPLASSKYIIISKLKTNRSQLKS